MHRKLIILVAGASLCILSGCAQKGELEIRARPTLLAAGEYSARFRVAEARSHLVLGNVALALEGFRKALREDTGSIDAMNGIAVCYDRMSRFDLSRRYYELALAGAPGDSRLYANLAFSLELQGRPGEAAGVRKELASRVAARQATSTRDATESNRTVDSRPALISGQDLLVAQHTEALAELSSWAGSRSALPKLVPHNSVGAALTESEAASSVSIRLRPASRVSDPLSNARLERLSLGEVALVTSGPLRWKPRLSHRPYGDRFAAPGAPYSFPRPLTLLNAARRQGLASHARTLLRLSGLRHVAVGNARQVQRSSVVIYPISRRAEALKIAGHLGFPLQARPGTDKRLVVYLGRDAALALLGLRR